MSLKETLDALREALSEDAMVAYREVLHRFDSQILEKRALRAGNLMPEFVLPNAEGKLISSAELLSERFPRNILLPRELVSVLRAPPSRRSTL